MISEFEATPAEAAVVQLSGRESLLRAAKIAGTETFTIKGEISSARPAWISLTANTDGTFSVQGFLRLQIEVTGGTAVVGTVS